MRSDFVTPRVRGGRLSSLLDISNVGLTRNANLYLIANIYLERYVPDASRTLQGVTVQPWGDAEWLNFASRFKSVIEDGWNNKFWLIPNGFWGADYPSNLSPTTRPNVRCCLTVNMATSAGAADSRFVCVRLADGQRQNWRSNMATIPAVSTIAQFLGLTEGDGLLSHVDLDSGEKGFDRRVMSQADRDRLPPDATLHQIVAMHEFGHFLGLHHVGGDGNHAGAYGETPEEQSSLMGRGSEMRAAHAWPWRNRIHAHLNAYNSQFAARLVRRPPRALTANEIEHHPARMQRRRMDPTRPSSGVPMADGGVPLP